MSLRSLAIAAAAAFGVALPAHAAYTTGSVNVRTGPGTAYPIIVTASPGAWVGVRACVPGWCQVTYVGIVGWMSASYIAGGPVAPRTVVRPAPYIYVQPARPIYVYPQPTVYPRPYVYPGPYVYRPYVYRPYVYRPGPTYGFSFSYGFGGPWW